jgi:hypothetical protein
MDTSFRSSRKFAALSGKRTLVLTACVCAGLTGRAMPALAQTLDAPAPNPILTPPPDPPPPPQPIEVVTPAHVIPSHLTIGNQTFEASVKGLRAYVESIRETQPQLYAQLAPDVERLESSRTAARAVLVTGLIAGAASVLYAVAGRGNCQEPSIYDPNFAAKSDAWGSCNQHDIEMRGLFAFMGVAAFAAGGFGAWALAPSRSDLLEVLNKNNRLSPEPLRLQLGYDPSHQLAFAGAALTF